MAIGDEVTSAAAPENVQAEALNFNKDQNVGEKRDLMGNGGIIKELLKRGAGWEYPEKGDKVTVHYVGTLESDGSEFDSSRTRGDPFTFTLGQGQVIRGWDVGVATMQKGELAKFTLKADYAYGDEGSPPKIPGGATLVFEVELLSWKSVKDIVGDGGVIKNIIKEGTGWATPRDPDEVLVEIKASVQGEAKPFYTSPEGGVEFTLHEGHLLHIPKGVGTAVKTMKKGEEVKLVVAPEYGFGAEGRTPDVPAGATLEIDVTLVSWKKVDKVTPDGCVVKKTLVETEEWQRPNAGATVTVAYVGRLPSDGTVFDERPASDPLVFITDEDQAPCEGLELGITQMKKGEKSLVSIAPAYGFGAQGCAQPKAVVPGDARLEYEVELIDFVKAKETWDMSIDEKLDAVIAAKDKGNAAFKAGKLERAIKLWERAKQCVENDDTFAAEQKKSSRDIKRSCDLNLAAAHLKAGRPVDARKAANKVLETDSFHLKALYRRAQSYVETADWVEAAQDIKKALGVEPNNMDFKTLARKLKLAEAAATKGEAALWAKSFQKTVTPATPNVPSETA